MLENKQRASLKVSLIPLVVIVFLILGIGYFLLQGEITLPKLRKGPTIQRLEGFPTVIYTQEDMKKQRRVIRNEQELDEFLNFVDKSGLLQMRESVNFEKEIILAVSSDTNEEVGRKIKIKKVYEDKEEKEIKVIIEETKPGETCTPEMDRNVTVDMVKLSKTDWEISFDRVTKVEECDQ